MMILLTCDQKLTKSPFSHTQYTRVNYEGRSKSFEPNLFRQGMDKRAHRPYLFFNIFIAFVNAQLVTITEFLNASK